MSKFFKALEQAERDRALRHQPTADVAHAVLPHVALPAAPRELALPAARPARDGAGPRGVAEPLVSLLAPASLEAEQYRVLRHAVEAMRGDARLQVVAVTSPTGGEGKTTTAINLAGALAQAPTARVLLVDADLRLPTVSRQLGLEDSRRGLRDLLLQPELTLAEAVQRLPRFNLSVLAAGGGTAAPYEALALPRLGELLEEARQRYDVIVLDAPPFVPVPDCRLIAGSVDGFLVIVAAHRTSRRGLAELFALLEPAKLVGLVFNREDRRPSPYYTAYGDHPPTDRGSRCRRFLGRRTQGETPRWAL